LYLLESSLMILLKNYELAKVGFQPEGVL